MRRSGSSTLPPSARTVRGGHLGEIPTLDKGPPWNGGRRAVPVRGFESHSLRCRDHHRTTPGGIPKLDKGTVCYTVRAHRRCVGSSPTPSARPVPPAALEAIRMVEEPGLNPGRAPRGFGRSNRPASALHPVDVAQWTEHRSTKPGVPGSTPGVDAREVHLPPVTHDHLAVAQLDRAPPSEGGDRTFESCRRGCRQHKRRPL